MDAPVDFQVFHEGERLMQTLVGVSERVVALGHQAIRDFMPEQHRRFFAQLPFIIVGSVDAGGQPWASILVNPPGFISSPDPYRLLIHAKPKNADPLRENLVASSSIALLGLEQHTRRRNRMNGIVERIGDDGFVVVVKQSFGNCPKYIQARQASYRDVECDNAVHVATTLDEAARKIITAADTLFIATAHPNSDQGGENSHGVDVSHRGGKPGFVRVDEDNTLTIPDFSGNHFFNTLGNIKLNPLAGLLFIDFFKRDVLSLATDCEIIVESSELAGFSGAERLLRFNVRAVQHAPASLALHWNDGAGQLSPFLARTGSW